MSKSDSGGEADAFGDLRVADSRVSGSATAD